MGLMKGNLQANQMQQGFTEQFTDEQERALKREAVVIQLRRYLRFLSLAGFAITFIIMLLDGRGGFWGALFMSAAISLIMYGIFVFFFVHIAVGWSLKIVLYLNSLFRGKARL